MSDDAVPSMVFAASPDADPMGADASGLNARGVDAQGANTQHVDRRGVGAPGTDAPSADVPGVDTPGVDTPDTTAVVAVRALCEFTARRGDLDLRFTPAPSALEGIAGHAIVAARRATGYESEIPLTGSHGALRVRGRADGYDPVANQLEEVKTYRGRFDAIPDNHRDLHWAQAQVYGHLLCEARGLTELHVALVYYDVGSQRETALIRTLSAEVLRGFFVAQCERYIAWWLQERAHRAARDAALTAMAFPHAGFRTGQRDLAVAVYRSAQTGARLMAQAPTGIGKTLGTVFPLLKAAPAERLDRVFFLTAKTSGRALALEAVHCLQQATPGLPLRTLELVARDKACEHPELACHPDSCPLAKGFYDRLPDARQAALAHPILHREAVRDTARDHAVCPYYLTQELARWSDVVVGDYNYYYDTHAWLFSLSRERQWRTGVLVDEAHNLLERGRAMYSATVSQAALKAARQSAPAALHKPLDRLNRSWNAFNREQQPAAYRTYAEPPAKLLTHLADAVSAIGEYLTETPLTHADPLLRFHGDATQMARLVDAFGAHSLFDATLAVPGDARSSAALCVRNVVPGPFLAARHAAAHTLTLFSGTLSPQHFYRETLGLPDDSGWVDVASPFEARQLRVTVAKRVSTRFQDRARSLAPIAALMAEQYHAHPGNYLGFLSSFDYLRQVAQQLQADHPEIVVWQQTPGMSEAEREQFLARFTPESQGIGLAVLGGAFSEGVDLPGARLVGAFIATLGLPQVNPVNEEMKRAMQATFGRGYDYTYLYPGLRKVVQAAGRVIRTVHDTGTVHLIDDRYARPQVRALLPAWWEVHV